MKLPIFAILFLPLCVFAQLQKTPPVQITAPISDPAIRIVGSTNQAAAYVSIHNETSPLFVVHKEGSIAVYSTTNHIKFGATNTAPVSTNAVVWVSVQVANDTNVYRMPLMK